MELPLEKYGVNLPKMWIFKLFTTTGHGRVVPFILDAAPKNAILNYEIIE